MDGSLSYDPSGNPITYYWECIYDTLMNCPGFPTNTSEVRISSDSLEQSEFQVTLIVNADGRFGTASVSIWVVEANIRIFEATVENST